MRQEQLLAPEEAAEKVRVLADWIETSLPRIARAWISHQLYWSKA
jgi:hypothetical protein